MTTSSTAADHSLGCEQLLACLRCQHSIQQTEHTVTKGHCLLACELSHLSRQAVLLQHTLVLPGGKVPAAQGGRQRHNQCSGDSTLLTRHSAGVAQSVQAAVTAFFNIYAEVVMLQATTACTPADPALPETKRAYEQAPPGHVPATTAQWHLVLLQQRCGSTCSTYSKT